MLSRTKKRLAGVAVAFAATNVGFAVSSLNQAQASVLLPGQTLTPVPSETLPTGTVSAYETQSFSASVIGEGVVFTGTLYSEALNVGTALAPQYDFIYQLTDNAGSQDAIARLSLSSFETFTTDVGYATANVEAGVTGNTSPSDATSDVVGSVIGFDFDPPALAPGNTTYSLIIATDSNSYINGNGAITDDGAADALAVVPAYGFSTPPVPEPASAALIMACGGLIMSRRRRKIG
jgi:hypothetical protein